MSSMTVENWRTRTLTDAYLFGWEREIERQKSAGEETDNDKAVAAGNAIERAVKKIVGPSTPGVPPHD